MIAMAIVYRAPDGTVFETTEALEAQYDLLGSLPEHVDESDRDYPYYVASYNARSEHARRDLRCELSIPYGPTLAETLDVFPGSAGGPIVVFVHGGSWIELTSTEFSFVASGFVANGATVIIPTYALCPAVTIPEITRQIRASIAWAYHNGSQYGADTSRIIVVGHSAGGHLVARLLETDWEGDYGIPSSVISAACAITGIFDLRPLPFTSDQPYLRLTADHVLQESPILNIPVSAPPLLMTFGSRQPREYRRQSVDYHRALVEAGLVAETWEREGFNHFDELDDFTDPGSELVRRILALGAENPS